MATKISSSSITLLLLLILALLSATAADVPASTCQTYECPEYETAYSAAEFNIRRYKAGGAWVSTAPISADASFQHSTRAGFIQLFAYIRGNNTQNRHISMTAPTVTEVAAGCGNSFIVRLPLAASAVVDPPAPDPADHLQFQPVSGDWCAAVRGFGGFATDDVVPQEAAWLRDSLAGTPWAARAVSPCDEGSFQYSVAQYNSPFEEQKRVNEIWFLWDAPPADSDSASC